MVQKALNAICETFDGCETLAYADLSIQLVLATNETSDKTRDDLNDLCAEAMLFLKEGNIGVVGTQSGFRLFFKDPDEPTEGLICLCTLGADLVTLMPAAQKCLADIASGGADA